jgi:hypothetical protein
MCEDFAQNFGSKEMAVASQQRIVSHFHFHQGILFYQKIILLSFPIHPTLLRSPIEDKTEIPPF